MNNENGKIKRDVERLKEKATKLGLPGKLWDLYDIIQYYPAWKTSGPERVCNAITDISEKGENELSFTYEGVPYEFHQRREDGSYEDTYWSYIYLTLKIRDQNVFEFKMSDKNCGSESRYQTEEWVLRDIEGFLDGDWVNPILKLSKTITVFASDVEKRKKDSDEIERLKKLKNKFGSAL